MNTVGTSKLYLPDRFLEIADNLIGQLPAGNIGVTKPELER